MKKPKLPKVKLLPIKEQESIEIKQKSSSILKREQMSVIHSKTGTCLFCLAGIPKFVYVKSKEPNIYIKVMVNEK